jgi:hypothetical protein
LGWIIGGIIVGFLLGIAITGLRAGTPPESFGDPEYNKVPVIRVNKPTGTILALGAGIMIGSAATLATHPRRAALAAGTVVSASSVATILLLQWQRGRWPIGTMDGRMFVVAGALLLFVCGAAVIAASTISFRRRPAV